MSKFEIIKTIVESNEHHPEKISGMFGKIIVDACVEELKKDLDLSRIKIMMESVIHLIDQIEICDLEIKEATIKLSNMKYWNIDGCEKTYPQSELDEAQETIDDFNKNRNGFIQQLKNLLNEI